MDLTKGLGALEGKALFEVTNTLEEIF